ncbi:Hypothetical protein BSSP2_I1338 [Brucella suis bv. 2]|nr:Hypothetical protein BSSP3_I1337 [Brucella suis bv. 2]AIB20493.1 Hypothetical protein BSPT1_I0387 [Brucella suis bv. 2]AIB23858.1 Hypothetical protein BSPT2_I0382 [Brucella suis bv. 2]AIB27250.1 Hypothetical protein BSSP1_I0381 [Brucella suis bv. 2]AIB31551.1 Hypothetical protein BSSP2_I1338 [Brucella suis bv. 2]
MLVAVLLQGLRCDSVGGKGLRHLLNGALILIQFKLVLIGSIHGFLPMSTAFMRRLEHKSRGLPTLLWNNVAHICNQQMRIFA